MLSTPSHQSVYFHLGSDVSDDSSDEDEDMEFTKIIKIKFRSENLILDFGSCESNLMSDMVSLQHVTKSTVLISY